MFPLVSRSRINVLTHRKLRLLLCAPLLVTSPQVRTRALSLYYKASGLVRCLGDLHFLWQYMDAVERAYEPLITAVAAKLGRRKLDRKQLTKNGREHRFFFFGLARQVMYALFIEMGEAGRFHDQVQALFARDKQLDVALLNDIIETFRATHMDDGTFVYLAVRTFAPHLHVACSRLTHLSLPRTPPPPPPPPPSCSPCASAIIIYTGAVP